MFALITMFSLVLKSPNLICCQCLQGGKNAVWTQTLCWRFMSIGTKPQTLNKDSPKVRHQPTAITPHFSSEMRNPVPTMLSKHHHASSRVPQEVHLVPPSVIYYFHKNGFIFVLKPSVWGGLILLLLFCCLFEAKWLCNSLSFGAKGHLPYKCDAFLLHL